MPAHFSFYGLLEFTSESEATVALDDAAQLLKASDQNVERSVVTRLDLVVRERTLHVDVDDKAAAGSWQPTLAVLRVVARSAVAGSITAWQHPGGRHMRRVDLIFAQGHPGSPRGGATN